jgi:hypothetical protein
MKKYLLSMLLVTSLLPLSLFAQDDNAVEEINVTGMRSSDYYDVPSIALKKKADFLVQGVKLINDSRSPELRKTEIIESIKNLISAASKIKGIELSYGENFLVPVNLNDDSLELIEDRKITDTSYVNISIKVAINTDKSAKLQIAELKKFVKSAKLVGRTELDARGDIGLSLINPEKYRYAILSLIATENKKLKQTFGESCKVVNDGLASRVEWDRTAVDELVLFIRHSTKVECK